MLINSKSLYEAFQNVHKATPSKVTEKTFDVDFVGGRVSAYGGNTWALDTFDIFPSPSKVFSGREPKDFTFTEDSFKAFRFLEEATLEVDNNNLVMVKPAKIIIPTVPSIPQVALLPPHDKWVAVNENVKRILYAVPTDIANSNYGVFVAEDKMAAGNYFQFAAAQTGYIEGISSLPPHIFKVIPPGPMSIIVEDRKVWLRVGTFMLSCPTNEKVNPLVLALGWHEQESPYFECSSQELLQAISIMESVNDKAALVWNGESVFLEYEGQHSTVVKANGSTGFRFGLYTTYLRTAIQALARKIDKEDDFTEESTLRIEYHTVEQNKALVVVGKDTRHFIPEVVGVR